MGPLKAEWGKKKIIEPNLGVATTKIIVASYPLSLPSPPKRGAGGHKH